MSVFQGRPLASLQPRLLKDGLNAVKAVGELHGRQDVGQRRQRWQRGRGDREKGPSYTRAKGWGKRVRKGALISNYCSRGRAYFHVRPSA